MRTQPRQQHRGRYGETFFLQVVMSGIFFAAVMVISVVDIPATLQIRGAIQYAVTNNADVVQQVTLPQQIQTAAEDIRNMVFGPAGEHLPPEQPLAEQPLTDQPLADLLPAEQQLSDQPAEPLQPAQPITEPEQQDFRIDEDILREMNPDEKKPQTEHLMP